jgi:cytochrome c
MRDGNKTSISLLTVTALVAILSFASGVDAQSPPKAGSATGESAVPSGDVDAGADIFESVCNECHGPAATAPTLRGVIGREVASVESFYGYSEALKAKKPMKWTVANLDAFIKSPTDFVPGTQMYKTIPDAKNRADLIAFIATLPPPREN